jgi:hypothetical protein
MIGDLRVISSGSGTDGPSEEIDEWEHVSISLKHRTPSWKEMCMVKEILTCSHSSISSLGPSVPLPDEITLKSPIMNVPQLAPLGLFGMRAN